MMMSFSCGFGGSGEEVDGKCSCEGMRELCDRVASRGSRCTRSAPSVVAGKAERFFGGSIAEGEMVKFLEEQESIEAMEGVYKVGFLFVNDGIGGSDVFEAAVCLVGMI